MKIFISWSGETSHQIALSFKEWLPYIFPISDFYLSSEDLRKGGRWPTDLANELNETNFGIICLTKSNISEPWILFEAGAISKQVNESYVCTVLFNLKPSEVKGPLAQFQATIIEKKEIFKLIQSINLALGEIKIKEQILNQIFDKWWPDFKQKINKIKPTQEEKSMVLPGRKTEDMLEEILSLLRGSKRDINKLKNIEFSVLADSVVRSIKEQKEYIKKKRKKLNSQGDSESVTLDEDDIW